MTYLGNDLQVAYPTYRNIDDISGSFNGVTTSFALLVGGVAPVPLPLNSQQCLISVAGVVLRPDDTGTEGFRLSGGNIIFQSAPSSGADFFGVILAGADYINVGVNFPSGSAAVPSITFDSDLDTGIYNSAANNISITTGGTQRLVVDSSGRLGLGTSSPSQTLDIVGDARITNSSGSTLIVNRTSNPGSVAFAHSGTETGQIQAVSGGGLNFYIGSTPSLKATIDSSGRLGLGTSAPNYQLHVTTSFAVGASGFNQQLSFTNDTIQSLLLGTGYTALKLNPLGGNVGIGTSNPGYLLDVAGQARFGGANGLLFGVGNAFVANQGELYSVGTTPMGLGTTGSASLQFYTNSTERARIDSSGRLLVGTTTARANFFNSTSTSQVQVEGTTNDTASAALIRSSTDNGGTVLYFAKQRGSIGANGLVSSGDKIATLSFQGSDGSEFVEAARIEAEVDGTPGTNDMPGRLVFSTTADGASSPTERMRIDSSGRLLVGASTARGLFFAGAVAAQTQIEGNSTATASLSITRNDATADGNALILAKARSSAYATLQYVDGTTSDDRIGRISFQGADGTNMVPAASI